MRWDCWPVFGAGANQAIKPVRKPIAPHPLVAAHLAYRRARARRIAMRFCAAVLCIGAVGLFLVMARPT